MIILLRIELAEGEASFEGDEMADVDFLGSPPHYVRPSRAAKAFHGSGSQKMAGLFRDQPISEGSGVYADKAAHVVSRSILCAAAFQVQAALDMGLWPARTIEAI